MVPEGRRRSLCLLSLLTVAPLFALALRPIFPIELPFAFIGMLNAMGSDRSATFAIDQAILPEEQRAERISSHPKERNEFVSGQSFRFEATGRGAL